MHPRLWQAIDQVGIRPSSRFEWKLASLLEWTDLEPYLTVCPGRAASVPDPDDPLETLVAWDKRDGTALLESPHIPAHRDPILVSDQELRLYRADVNILARELAARFNFTAQPTHDSGPLFRIGIVQTKAQPQVAVFLFVPGINPFGSAAALHSIAGQREKTLLLLPSARWLRALPSLTDSVQVRTVLEFLSGNEEDHLTTVVARISTTRTKPMTSDVLQVRQGDRWEDVKMILNPSTGRVRISIGNRHIDITVWNPSQRSQGRKTGTTRFAVILGRIAVASPKLWRNSDLPPSEQGTMRKAFQMLKNRLADWVPIADGEPFEYDRKTQTHRPRFQIDLAKATNR